eukprot:gene37836-49576_t
MEYNEVPPDLQPILPPGDVEIDFDNINCELGGQECDIVEDSELLRDVGIGWQYLCVDLRDVVKRCFGSTYTTCYEVQVRGPTRVSKIYFQLKHYAEVDLPMFLRVIS